MKKAITQAMDECIKEGILYDILTKQRAEVLGVVLSTFNKELYEKNLKKAAYMEGHEDGLRQGHDEGFTQGVCEKLKQQIKLKLTKGKTPEEIADALEEDIEVIKELIKELTES